MINYNDKRWCMLNGGYKTPYNPVNDFLRFENEIEFEQSWKNLWENLHHQGDVGDASYASVPVLIDIYQRKRNLDWNLYALISTIEIERHRKSNPKLPDWLKEEYSASLKILFNIALDDLSKIDDLLTVRCILGFIALYKGLIKYGALISNFDESEIDETVDEYLAWNELYE